MRGYGCADSVLIKSRDCGDCRVAIRVVRKGRPAASWEGGSSSSVPNGHTKHSRGGWVGEKKRGEETRKEEIVHSTAEIT